LDLSTWVAGFAAASGLLQWTHKTEMTMFKHSESLLAAALAMTFFPAFAADFPVGTYLVDGSKTALTFDAKGKFHVEESMKTLVAGSYTVKGSQIQFTDQEGPWACTKSGEKTGSYSWSVDNSGLSFTKVADSCADRATSLAGAKWKAQP
jgi:hypothetical protein